MRKRLGREWAILAAGVVAGLVVVPLKNESSSGSDGLWLPGQTETVVLEGPEPGFMRE